MEIEWIPEAVKAILAETAKKLSDVKGRGYITMTTNELLNGNARNLPKGGNADRRSDKNLRR